MVPSSSRKSTGGLSPKIVLAGTFSAFSPKEGIDKFSDSEFPTTQALPVVRQAKRLKLSKEPLGETVRLTELKAVSLTENNGSAKSMKTKLAELKL